MPTRVERCLRLDHSLTPKSLQAPAMIARRHAGAAGFAGCRILAQFMVTVVVIGVKIVEAQMVAEEVRGGVGE